MTPIDPFAQGSCGAEYAGQGSYSANNFEDGFPDFDSLGRGSTNQGFCGGEDFGNGSAGEPFLDYEPLRIHNPFYCNLRNAWRALNIYTSLILDPRIGPVGASGTRFGHAVEICRTLAALGRWDTSYCEFGKLWVILLAGKKFRISRF